MLPKCSNKCKEMNYVFFLIYNLQFSFYRNELRKVPSQVQAFTIKKQYLHATKTLIQGLDLANGPLSPVEGLSDLRTDLENRVQLLYGKLIEELHKHLYQLSTSETLSNFHRHGSTRNSNYNSSTPIASGHHHHTPGCQTLSVGSSPFQRNGMRRSAERAEANQKMRKILFDLSQGGFDLNKTELIADTDLLDSDASFFIIVECFTLLKRATESIEVFSMAMVTFSLFIYCVSYSDNKITNSTRTTRFSDKNYTAHFSHTSKFSGDRINTNSTSPIGITRIGLYTI